MLSAVNMRAMRTMRTRDPLLGLPAGCEGMARVDVSQSRARADQMQREEENGKSALERKCQEQQKRIPT